MANDERMDNSVGQVDPDDFSSFLNICIPTNDILSLDYVDPNLFQENDEEQKTPSLTEDFLPSDGSDYDPKKSGYSSEQTTDDGLDDMKKPKKRCLKRRLLLKMSDSDERYEKKQTQKKDEERKNESYYDPKKTDYSSEQTTDIEKRKKNNSEFKNDEERDNEPDNQINVDNAIQISEKRAWNRRNACFYCQNIVTNYTRHLIRNHTKEIEVIKYQAINDEDPKIRKQKRQAITDRLRNQGNFLHNSKVSFDRDGEATLLPSKRNNKGTSSPSSYATCKECLGTFKRSTFFRHLKNCRNNAEEHALPSFRRKALYTHSITIVPNTVNATDELRKNVLSHLRCDEISLVVKNDALIVAYGSRLLKKKKERRSRKAICSKMRDLATLLNILRKKDSTIDSLTDAIDPEKYETFIAAIKSMCGFDEETGSVNVPSIPARMRPAVLGCIEILYTQSIMSTDSTAYKEAYKKKLDDFKHLIEINWQWEISSNAEKTRKRNNMTKEKIIPLDDDIATVMRQIHKLEIRYAEKLRKNRDSLNYESLCIVTISHIIMLDRKRAGDVAEAELTFYVNRKNEDVPEKVLETLTQEQRKSIKDLDVFQIPGKRTRAVPILLTITMRENIDLIIACREQLGIPSSNKYLFARPGTQEPFDGGKCLERIKLQCNLKRPEMVTSTGMRHHIATMSQIHSNQNDQYTEHLAGFLGHNIAVHAQNYRLPLQVLQKAVVGTQLIEYENTLTEKKQKRIETITSQDEEECENTITDKKQKKIENITSQNKQDYKNTLTDKNQKKIETITSQDEQDENNPDYYLFENEELVSKRTRAVKPDLTETTEIELPIQKRNKVVHRKWSNEEIKTVKKHFQSYINKKVNPGKSKCVEVINKEPILMNRTWMQLNTYVNNLYKK